MHISEDRLRQLAIEAAYLCLVEYYVDIELEKILTEDDKADWDAAKWKARRAKARNAAIGALGMGGIFGGLKMATDHHRDTKAADTEAAIEDRIAAAESDESQLEDFADQLNNTARYMWGVGDQGAMPVPGTDGKITVLPPSYSVAVRAFLDKKANIERAANGEKPIMRYGQLNIEDIPHIGGEYEYQGAYEDNVKDFFKVYSGSDMVDAMDVLQRVPELQIVSGTGTENRIIMVNPNKIDPNYVLPELGMTAQDYYNSQYGTFLGSGEIEALNLPDEVMTVTPEDDSEKLDQGLIDATNKRAQQHQKQRMKESRITWKNYKNRKKILAQSIGTWYINM